MKFVVRIRAVGFRVVGRGFDEPRITTTPHQAAKLARNHPSLAMNEPFRKHDGRRQIVASPRHRGPRDRRDGRPIARSWLATVKPLRQRSTPGENVHLPFPMSAMAPRQPPTLPPHLTP